jgi:hypothetical protein
VQSTQQAFYFFTDVEDAEEGDIIEAYHDDTLVGSRVWAGPYTDIPAMGKDSQGETVDYCTAGSTPTFKLIKQNGIKMNLYGQFPVWNQNGTYIVGDVSSSEVAPENYGLSDAYPNPFNPVTTIHFQIPMESVVNIAVYDINGKQLDVISNTSYSAGQHQVRWDGSNHSSGVYIIKMMADGFSDNVYTT